MSKPKKKSQFSPASPKQALMLKRASDTQILIVGGAAGSGKSYLLQLMPLLLVDDPDTNCVMFRRTNPQIKGAGGIFETGCGIYNSLPKNMRPKIRNQDMEVVFPRKDEFGKLHYDGAKIKYQQAENVAASKLNAQGLQWTFVGIDEGTQFEWEQIEYFMSRLRSQSAHFSRMVISCNPDPDHEIRKMIDWYLDEDGFPRPDRDGVKRYFIQMGGDYIWGDTQKEIADKYDIPEDKWEGKILSFSFVSGKIFDNPPMIKNNPAYLAFLEGLNEVDKAQLLHGSWNARPKGASYWERDWLTPIPSNDLPSQHTSCRAYDLAATERSQANKFPDPTACVKMFKCKRGFYYIAGDYQEDIYDEHYNIFGQMCKRSGDRDMHIIKQGKHDGKETPIVLPVDPGAAGKTAYQEMAKTFMAEGFIVKKDPTATNKSKLIRFQPFASACENGLVFILEDTFDPVTRDFIYKQLEAFDGERSTASRKDDFVDAMATAYNFLAKTPVRSYNYSLSVDSQTNLSKWKNR